MIDEGGKPRASEPIGEYRTSPWKLLRRLALAAIAFALAAALVAARRVEGTPVYAALALAALVALLLFGVWQMIVIARLLWRNPHLLLYDVGLRYLSQGGEERWRWDSFSALQKNVRRFRLLGITLFASGGWHLYVGDAKVLSVGHSYQRVRELGDALELKTAEALWPRYTDSFQRGKKLSFGKISINQDRIWQGKTTVRWPELESWEMRRDTLTLKQHDGKVTRFHTRGVPNAHLLLMVVESVGQYRREPNSR